SSDRRLCRSDSQGRKARRPADPAVHKIRTRHQYQDRQDTWYQRAIASSANRRRGDRMRRREFITVLGGAATWPLAARAQQSAVPVVGFLNTLGQNDRPNLPAAFRRGLDETGYVDGRNVAIEYRFAENQHDRLPALAADLVGRKVNVIAATGGGASVLAAMAATKTIPIVFTSGGDPIDLGLVESLNKPGGNLTGVTFFLGALEAKRLELLHELLPKAALIGALVNPTFPVSKTRLED